MRADMSPRGTLAGVRADMSAPDFPGATGRRTSATGIVVGATSPALALDGILAPGAFADTGATIAITDEIQITISLTDAGCLFPRDTFTGRVPATRSGTAGGSR